MARAGAKVLINDIGASLAGEGRSASPAEETKQLIEGPVGPRRSAPTRSPNGLGAEDRAGGVRPFRRLDVVVNNAGVSARPDLPPHDGRGLADGDLGASQRQLFCEPCGRRSVPQAGERRLYPHHQHLGADRQYGPGQLRLGKARNYCVVEGDRDRHEAVQRALELSVALGVEPDDPVDPGTHRGGAGARRQDPADDPRQERADGGVSRFETRRAR